MPTKAPQVEMAVALGDEAWGKIVIELDEAKAPATVRNFLTYVDDGFYNGTVFHRVIPTFMIQGGGYVSAAEKKASGLREPIKNEAGNGLKNARGTIAMARTSDPHSATAQFFINVQDNTGLDHPGHDGWGYCVFGKVIEGIDVVDRIKAVPTQLHPMTREESQPVDPPMIKSVKRLAGE